MISSRSVRNAFGSYSDNLMAQAASSSLPLRRTSRKIKPKVDPDFEYDYVQQRIDQLDRELAASGLSPRVSQVPSSPGRPSIPLRQMTESPATSQAADLTAQTISSPSCSEIS